MKRLIFLMLMLILAVTYVYAASVSASVAERVAGNFVLERVGANYNVASSKLLGSSDKDSYIHVINLNPTGFVLVAADDAALPIIGYSTNNRWNEYDIPPQMQYMLKSWNEQMRAIVTQRMVATPEITHEWSRYNVAAFSFIPNRDFRNINPLISSIWGQGTYYNALCPSGTPVGCVATAMAQIMRYWSFPAVGSGSYSYNHPVYGIQSANFGATAYNWAAMPNNVTSANAAVATIGRHAGVAVNMQYAPDGSGAYSTDVPNALITYFKYASTTQYRSKSSYTSAVWEAMMKGELDNARPVYYSGSSAGSGGHAWIIDGYQGSNFHVNWGWNGSYNGYFALTALNPGGDNFTSNQAAVVGIAPTSTLPTLSEGFEATTFPPTGWTVTASSFARSTATPLISGVATARFGNTGTGTAQSGKQLVTPALTIDATCPALTFKARTGTTARSEQIKVGYSTSQSGPWTYFSTNAVLTTTVQTFTYAVNALPANTYYFVLETFCSVGNSAARAWIIDDVAGPYRPIPTQASLNMSSWSAGALSPGDQARSGNIFTLANVGTGNLTVTSVTSLSGTDFTTNFNPNINLVYGQTHDFGFTYDPLNYGTDNVNFQIVTSGGTVTIALSGSATFAVFYDGFENYSNFALSFPPWTQHDGDGLTTWGVNGYTWTNVNYTGAWMVFNPSATSPSMAGTTPAYSGSKLASCWAANSTTVANNDWMISPELTLTTAGTVSFYAMSFSGSYLENMSVKYSTTTNATSAFTNTLATVASVPAAWTNYSYAIPQNCKYIAIQCTSLDKFALWVDEFKVSDSSTPPTPTFGNLSGYVYKFGTTESISNAVITVGTKQAVTDAYGFYQINNILTGTVSINVTAPGMFYHPTSVSGIVISNGSTTTQNFGLKWGELTANPTSVSMNLYQGETGNAQVVLSNPGGTTDTAYAGYFVGSSRGTHETAPYISDRRKPSPTKHGVRIPPITDAPPADRFTGWFSYAGIGDANLFSGAQTERGNYFLLSDFALMDGAVTLSQLRGHFYNPATAAWTTAAHRTFAWKVYSVSPTGTITLLHTSANIVLPTIATNTSTLNEYTLPTAITIPAGHDFIVTAKPSSATDTSGRPQSLATDASSDNGILYDATNGWQFTGSDYLIDANVSGTDWLTAYNFSGTIAPGGSVTLPLNFNTVGVSAGTKNAFMYIHNDANYTAPSPTGRGDMLAVPITLNVTVATTPVAVLTGSSWVTSANVGTPSTTGNVYTLTNVGPGTLTISSVTGLAGTPFTTNINTGISLVQNATHNFGFTFTPTASGIYTATCTITTNGGTRTITLKGYANYVAEGFEGVSFPPDGWMMSDVDGDTYNWMQYTATGAARTGLSCAGSASYVNDTRSAERPSPSSRAALTPNNWLITPRLTISTGDELSYWIAAQDPAWPAEYYSVKLSTTNNQIASFTNTLFSETLTNGTWYNRVINLSAFAGQSVFIAFQHHNCTDQFVLKLDDVLMPPLAAPLVYGNLMGRVRKAGTDVNIVGATVSVAGRTATTDAAGGYSFSSIVVDTYPITVTATGCVAYNNSVTIVQDQTITHNVFLDYAEFYTATTTYNVSVPTGSSSTIPLTLSNVGTASLDWTSDSGIWGGDTFVSANLNQDWESEDLTGWTGSIGAYSDIYGSAATPYGYNSQMTWVFASNLETTLQYLVTPKMRVSAGDNLAFWYKQFNLSDETFTLKVSTTDNLYASFTNTLATIGPLTTTDWTNFSASLNAYAGQDIYVCFEYPRVDGYQYGYVMIDAITGSPVMASPTEWLSSNPATGSLNASGSAPVSLIANAATLPVGSYTAQTWFFGTATNSPYKVYVNLTVTEALGVTAPQNLIIEKIDQILAIAWDDVDNANSYRVYGSTSPNANWELIETVENAYIEMSEATLMAHGLDSRAFFHVIADTASRQTASIAAKNVRTAAPLPISMRSPNTKSHGILSKM